MITNLTLSVALELGLHRSSKRWMQPSHQRNYLDIELRKRVFYSIYAVHVGLSGKLGRPMPLRAEDFDVELPEPVDDEFITETSIDLSRRGQCSFLVAIEAYKIAILFQELFSTLYAVAPLERDSYTATVSRLDANIQKWRNEWDPLILTATTQEHRVFLTYMETWYHEYRILLRHPSLSQSTSQHFNRESLDICMDSSRKMLQAVRQLQKDKSLDTTWYAGAVLLMAITTNLFGHWERRAEITIEQLATLRLDMDMWLNIMGEVGGLLGK
jgi:Fungal specific transcription factor domain